MTAAPFDAARFRDRIQEVLDAFLDEQAARLAPLGPDADALLAEARQAVSGGKRLRAAFCWWGFMAAGGGSGTAAAAPGTVAHETALLRACAALEVLHASALVHDDFMDASDTRRGRPATHRLFGAAHREAGWSGDPEQYGAAAAILLGDLLLTWADELLRRCGLPLAQVAPALDVFDLCRSEVVAGQFLDVSVQARGQASVETAMTVLRYKSAKYSIERPLHIGAALAGGSADLLAALTDFGLPLGEAFQLRDDQLGVFGDPAVTGKPAGDDLVEGKRTVLVALTLEGATPEGRDLLERSLGRPLGVVEVDAVRTVIRDSGAEARVEAMIEELTGRAVTALGSPAIDDAARGALADLAAAAVRRST